MARYEGPFVDADVHQRLSDPLDILDYLPREWHDYIRGNGHEPFSMMPPVSAGVVMHHDFNRADTRPEGRGAYSSGSDYETLKRQLLDSEQDYRAILTHELGEYGGQFNQYLSRALASATNDWNMDAWLAKDDRLFSTIVVPLSEPQEAAKEVRRVAWHDQMVGVLLTGNTLGRPIGDPLYHPIYDAAVECGLPVVVHISLVARPNQSVTIAGGRPSYLMHAAGVQQQFEHYISSLIVHGVFEQFPSLNFLLSESTITWLPYAMARLDSGYELLKAESPWVKRLPSEYVREHIRLSTQPLDESFEDKGALVRLLETVDGIEDMLCFSSDYPHATMDDPPYTARRMPDAWQAKVMHENASKLFGLPIHAGVAAAA